MSRGNHSLFISIEGGEGAGKTTLIEGLEAYFNSQNLDVLKTREPGGTLFGEKIRSWLLSHGSKFKMGAKAELLLFLSARSQHIEEVIKPALDSGKVVLCDRFNDSTIAYQGAGRGLGVSWVKKLCEAVCDSTLPKLTIYLDINPEVGLTRSRDIAKREAAAGELDRIEAEHRSFHEKVRQAFLDIQKEEAGRFFVLDAHQPRDEVLKEAIALIHHFIGN